MKKIVFVLVALALMAFPATVYAGDGVLNNPNHFELDMNCEGKMIHVIIPSGAGESSGGRTEDGIIGHPRTHKIDFEGDGTWDLEFVLAQGKGFDTVWCTWSFSGDQVIHGMDIQFVPAK